MDLYGFIGKNGGWTLITQQESGINMVCSNRNRGQSWIKQQEYVVCQDDCGYMTNIWRYTTMNQWHALSRQTNEDITSYHHCPSSDFTVSDDWVQFPELEIGIRYEDAVFHCHTEPTFRAAEAWTLAVSYICCFTQCFFLLKENLKETMGFQCFFFKNMFLPPHDRGFLSFLQDFSHPISGCTVGMLPHDQPPGRSDGPIRSGWCCQQVPPKWRFWKGSCYFDWWLKGL